MIESLDFGLSATLTAFARNRSTVHGDSMRVTERLRWTNAAAWAIVGWTQAAAAARRKSELTASPPLSASMVRPEYVIFCGRTFDAGELELMRQVARECSALAVTEIARTVCELLEWKRPSGKLKNHECRQLLERLQAQGLLQLPAVRKFGGRGPRQANCSSSGAQPPAIEGTVGEYEPVELVLVQGEADSRSWREQVERYHYLRCPVPFGAHLRYWVRSGDRELACVLWNSPAWKMQARDAWVGWSQAQRQRHLQRIVNNGRFLILPWVRIKGLASRILALSARRMPGDWERQYGYRPLLLETLVDAARFRGTCYRAANWVHVGQSAGRGRMDRKHSAHGQAVKDIYVYPLERDARQQLCSDSAR